MLKRKMYDRLAEIHASGHACQEELKIMHNLLNPKFFIPVHGEYRMLVKHAELAKGMGIEASDGIVIAGVKEDSAAEKAGLQKGDIITQVNGSDINSEADLEKAVKDGEKKQSSVFLIERSTVPMFLVVSHK